MQIVLQGITAFAAFIFYNSLKTSVLIALVLLVQKALGRFLSSNGYYLLWLPVVISLLTPFGYKTQLPQPSFIPQQLVLPMFNSPAPTNLYPGTARHASLPPSVDRPDASQPLAVQALDSAPILQTNQSSPIAWLSLLSLVWLAGVLLFLGIVLVRNWRFSTLVRQALPADRVLQNLLATCCEETKCKTTVRLLMSPEIDAPLVAGCFTPALLLPAGLELQLSATQLRHVFLHELMHIKRKDIAGNWLLTLMQGLHWFNPLVWFGLTQMRHDRELVCDAATLHHLGLQDGQAYGHTLLQLCQPQPCRFIATHGIGIVDSQSQLRRRILLIVQASLPSRFQSALTALLLLVLGGLAFSQPVVESTVETTVEATAPTQIATPVPPAAFTAAVVIPATQPAAVSAKPMLEPEQNTAAPSPSLPAMHAVKSKPATIKSTAAAIPVTNRSTATGSEKVAAKTAATALIAMVDATPPHTVTSAAEIITAKPQATWPGLAAMGALTQSIREAKSADLKFITEWNTIADECKILPDQHKRRIPCERVKVMKSSDKFADLKSQCAALADNYNKLARDFSATPEAAFANREAIAATMLGNYQDLTEFCSVATYSKNYPAFAKLFVAATANSRIAKMQTDFGDNFFSDSTFTYPGTGVGANVGISPPQLSSGYNPATYDVGAIFGGAGSSGAGGTANAGTGSSGGGHTP